MLEIMRTWSHPLFLDVSTNFKIHGIKRGDVPLFDGTRLASSARVASAAALRRNELDKLGSMADSPRSLGLAGSYGHTEDGVTPI